jgi:beta-glucosidase/6-phospho-beta-glucosidase/beta-galactosidase
MLSTTGRRIGVRRLLQPRPDPFPADFLFGVGTSDHQCEAFDPRYPDVWDDWEASHPIRHPGEDCCLQRGRATDFWQRYAADVRLAQSLGCKAFRFSIAWARVEPEPGQFSDEALAHYRRVAETIRAA